jgi:catalase
MSDDRPVTTTDAGIPAASDEFSLTVGPGGPTVLHDHYVVQKMQHFNRERVPERVVHAKGSGAHGFFEVTEDVTQLTKVAFLSAVGQRTPVFVRFSTVAGELGSPDTWRDPRGADDDDFAQPRALYCDVMTDTDKDHLVTNIVSHAKAGVTPQVVPRVIEYWASVHPDLGAQVSKQLNGA